MDTGLIERGAAATEPDPGERAAAAGAAALIELLDLTERGGGGDPWDALVGWRIDGHAPVELRLLAARASEPLRVSVEPHPPDALVRIDELELRAGVERLAADRFAVRSGGRRRVWHHASLGDERWLAAGADTFCFRVLEPVVEGSDAAGEGALEAPMPGLVLAVRTCEGATVEEGEVLVVMESMKMELSLTAPTAATVGAVHVTDGQTVRQGQLVVELVTEAP
jgi:acetyl/propionyl-CoA carboxylase alpha subunit